MDIRRNMDGSEDPLELNNDDSMEDDHQLTYEDQQDLFELNEERKSNIEQESFQIESGDEDDFSDSSMSELDDSYGLEGNEEDHLGEYSHEEYYNEDEEMEDDLFDQLNGDDDEEGEDEIIPLHGLDDPLL